MRFLEIEKLVRDYVFAGDLESAGRVLDNVSMDELFAIKKDLLEILYRRPTIDEKAFDFLIAHRSDSFVQCNSNLPKYLSGLLVAIMSGYDTEGTMEKKFAYLLRVAERPHYGAGTNDQWIDRNTTNRRDNTWENRTGTIQNMCANFMLGAINTFKEEEHPNAAHALADKFIKQFSI